MSDFEREPVPTHKTKHWFSIVLIIAGVGITIPSFINVANASLSLGFVDTMIAVVISSAIMAICGALTGYVGGSTNLSSYMIIQNTFGLKGAKLINTIFSLSLMGWFGVTLSFFAEAANNILDIGSGVWLAIGTLLMVMTAIFGFKGLHMLSVVAVPLLLIVLYALPIFSLQKIAFTEVLQIKGNLSLSIGLCISMFVGAWMVGISIMPDLTRYSNSPKSGAIAGMISFLCFSIIVSPFIIPTLVFQDNDIISIILKFGHPTIALLVVIFATWSSNDNNLYSAALGFSVVFKKLKKTSIVIGAGLIGYIFSIMDIVGNFIPFLIVLSITIPPIAAIYTMDFFLGRKYSYNKRSININAFVSWGAGMFVSFATTSTASYGVGLFSLTTVPALDGYLVSGTVYYALRKWHLGRKKK